MEMGTYILKILFLGARGNMTITIKKCQREDIHLLQKISIETFNDTFKEQNTAENMKVYLDEAFTTEKLLSELAHFQSEFYFLYEEDQVAGYLKINIGEAQSENMGKAALEIERIYIRKAFQRKGFGKYLFDQAMERAAEQRKTKIWLGVWEKNEQALQFYRKLGFEQSGAHSFWMGDDEQVDLIMMKNI